MNYQRPFERLMGMTKASFSPAKFDLFYEIWARIFQSTRLVKYCKIKGMERTGKFILKVGIKNLVVLRKALSRIIKYKGTRKNSNIYFEGR